MAGNEPGSVDEFFASDRAHRGAESIRKYFHDHPEQAEQINRLADAIKAGLPDVLRSSDANESGPQGGTEP